MKSSKELRESIGELFDKAQAIQQVAEEDKRDLSPEEKTDIDAILAEIGEEAGEDGKPTGIWADVKWAERYEKAQARITANRTGVRPQQGDVPQNGGHSFEIPRAARYYGGKRLRAFNGPHADYEAYASGQFFLALFGNDRSRQWCADHGVNISNVMGGNENAKGGFLVPDEFENTVIDLRETYGVFRQNVMVTPMAGDHKVQPRRKSGLTAYAVGDNDEITASDKEWSQVELIAKKWGCLAKYSSELDEDSVIGLADNLADEMAYAFSQKEDESGFIGDGTSTYHGVQGIVTKVGSASTHDALSGNTGFETLDLEDFEGAVSKLPQYANTANTAWYIHSTGYWLSMANLVNAAGGNNIADLGRGPERMFLGYPVRFSQVLNSTAGADTSAIKCLIGDLTLSSTLGNRRGLNVMVSQDRYFELDQVGIKGTTRFAINNHDVGDGTNAGPVVALKTAAS